jgi:hypothetical protein
MHIGAAVAPDRQHDIGASHRLVLVPHGTPGAPPPPGSPESTAGAVTSPLGATSDPPDASDPGPVPPPPVSAVAVASEREAASEVAPVSAFAVVPGLPSVTPSPGVVFVLDPHPKANAVVRVMAPGHRRHIEVTLAFSLSGARTGARVANQRRCAEGDRWANGALNIAFRSSQSDCSPPRVKAPFASLASPNGPSDLS